MAGVYFKEATKVKEIADKLIVWKKRKSQKLLVFRSMKKWLRNAMN
jgi:hypothetical protein